MRRVSSCLELAATRPPASARSISRRTGTRKAGVAHLGLLFSELDKKVLVEVKNGNGKAKFLETTRGQLVLEKLVDMAISGSEFAQALIFERTEGKVTTNAGSQTPNACSEGGLPSVSEAMAKYLAAVATVYQQQLVTWPLKPGDRVIALARSYCQKLTGR